MTFEWNNKPEKKRKNGKKTIKINLNTLRVKRFTQGSHQDTVSRRAINDRSQIETAF